MDLFVIGAIVGVLIVMIFNFLFSGCTSYGVLRIDKSTGDPVILLEISNEDLKDIPKLEYVTFKVLNEDLPRE